MLFSRSTPVLSSDFRLSEYFELADFLCHTEPVVAPVFECVKVFARINTAGQFTYARHRFNLGSQTVSKYEIVEKIGGKHRSAIILSALNELENKCFDIWPFAPGSASWCLLEILHPKIKLASEGNNPTVLFRRANRISPKGILSESKLLKDVFITLEDELPSIESDLFDFVLCPEVRLQNISGSGAYTKFKSELDAISYLCGQEDKSTSMIDNMLRENLHAAFNELIDVILESNFSISLERNPGFIFTFNGGEHKLQSALFEKERRRISDESRAAFGRVSTLPPPLSPIVIK